MSVSLVVATPPYRGEGPCSACCTSRGLTAGELVEHARAAAVHDLAEAPMRHERVLSF